MSADLIFPKMHTGVHAKAESFECAFWGGLRCTDICRVIEFLLCDEAETAKRQSVPCIFS